MAATFDFDLLGTDLAHPRPRPRFATPPAPPPRAVPKPVVQANLDAPVWPGAPTEPPAPIRVEVPGEPAWIRVTPPVVVEQVVGPEVELELDPDDLDDLLAELLELQADEDDVADELLELVSPDDDPAEDDVAAELLELELPDDDEAEAIVEDAIGHSVACWAPVATGRRIERGATALQGPMAHRGFGVLAETRSRRDAGDRPAGPVAVIEAVAAVEAVAVVETVAVIEAVAAVEAVAVVETVAAIEAVTAAELAFDAFENEWFAEEPLYAEEPRRVAWWEVALPVSAGLGATAILSTVIAIARAWG